MRTTTQIDKEVAKLKRLLSEMDRWNTETRKTMEAQQLALEERMTADQVEAKWYQAEGDEDYREGDNDLYHEVIRTVHWMNGIPHYDAPSKGAE